MDCNCVSLSAVTAKAGRLLSFKHEFPLCPAALLCLARNGLAEDVQLRAIAVEMRAGVQTLKLGSGTYIAATGDGSLTLRFFSMAQEQQSVNRLPLGHPI